MKNNTDSLEQFFLTQKINFEKDVSFKDLTTFGTGGQAEFVAMVTEIPELIKIVKFLKSKDIKYRVIGAGSNILAPDKNFMGAIIKLNGEFDRFSLGRTSTVYAGVNLLNYCYKSACNGYSGVENLAGIPGTVGGAIFGNAGANGSEISNTVKSVLVLDESGEPKTLNKEECKFGYRDSIFKHKDYIILQAELSLEKVKQELSIKKFQDAINKRKTVGLEGRNAGSIFKNPPGNYAGKLIEEAGFKGFETENVIVSNKHSNIICVKNNMVTSAEILEIITKIQKEVYNRFNIKLETEVQVL